MRAFPRLQMILVLACDEAVPENRMAVDRDGAPVVHYRFTPDGGGALVAATRAAARIFFAAGARAGARARRRIRRCSSGATPTALDALIRRATFPAGTHHRLRRAPHGRLRRWGGTPRTP